MGTTVALKRPSTGQASTIAAISCAAAAVSIAIAQIELNGQPELDIWTNAWLLLALSLAAAGLTVAVVSFVMSIFVRAPQQAGRIPAQLVQRTIPISDGLHAGTLLAIEVQAVRNLEQARVVMTDITGPPDAAVIPPPARLYWHPSRDISTTIAQGASNCINVARAGPLPTCALIDTREFDLPWTLPNGQWRVELQLTATGYSALIISATFNVSPADGFPTQRFEWLTFTTRRER